MATITSDIGATQQLIAVSDGGNPAAASLWRVDDEVIAVRFVREDGVTWMVSRGAYGTTAATHSASAEVTAVSLTIGLDSPA
jgi:hypothetical protein